ncbi:MAG: hypothetical protein Ct9H300mP12_10550 [Acidimicrobiales bacterium]|nr:MAG: hypothetical protein Ct9H300mP12_10550 [Acidimicrobiales bacterium]
MGMNAPITCCMFQQWRWKVHPSRVGYPPPLPGYGSPPAARSSATAAGMACLSAAPSPTRPERDNIRPNRARSRSVQDIPPHDTAIPRLSSTTEASSSAPIGPQIFSDTPSTQRRPVARAVAQASTSVVTDL